MVMAAGVNFNNVWAARGVPVDVTKTQAAASLERCGGDSGKMVLLRDWLRAKVQQKDASAAE